MNHDSVTSINLAEACSARVCVPESDCDECVRAVFVTKTDRRRGSFEKFLLFVCEGGFRSFRRESEESCCFSGTVSVLPLTFC